MKTGVGAQSLRRTKSCVARMPSTAQVMPLPGTATAWLGWHPLQLAVQVSWLTAWRSAVSFINKGSAGVVYSAVSLTAYGSNAPPAKVRPLVSHLYDEGDPSRSIACYHFRYHFRRVGGGQL